MDLLSELKSLIAKHDKVDNYYLKLIDMCEKEHYRFTDVKPGLVFVLPRKWEKDIIRTLHIPPAKDPIYFNVSNPFGVLDMMMFHNVETPIVYIKVLNKSK